MNFTGPQLAELAGIPYVTLAKFVTAGVVTPSVRKGDGSGNVSVWGLADVVAVASFGALRPSPAVADRLRALFDAWHSARGRALVGAPTRSRAARSGTTFVVVADDGRVVFEDESDLGALSKKYGPRMFVVDAVALVEGVKLDATEKRMMRLHLEPAPSGRVPREKRSGGKRKPGHPRKSQERSAASKREGAESHRAKAHHEKPDRRRP
jgi:hypothetical protein